MAGLSKTPVNIEVLAELDLVEEGTFGLVTNYGRRSLTDYVKVGDGTGNFSFRRLRRPIQTRRPHAGEAADQSSGAEAWIPLNVAHRASVP
jgi:hypothetical protein